MVYQGQHCSRNRATMSATAPAATSTRTPGAVTTQQHAPVLLTPTPIRT